MYLLVLENLRRQAAKKCRVCVECLLRVVDLNVFRSELASGDPFLELKIYQFRKLVRKLDLLSKEIFEIKIGEKVT